MPLDLVKTLGELIATPSVNPMGHKVSGPEFLETRITALLEEYFRALQLPVERQTVEPGRDNILTRLDGFPSLEQGGDLLLWEVHQDTVPVTGMTIPPFTPEIRDGRMFGRGACDVKGGMAAMLNALARLAADAPANRGARRPTLVLACTVSEEFGFTGVTALSRFWGQGSRLLPRVPDLAIVAEPTELQVVVAHKGVVRWRCHTRGRAAHSSQPDSGDNAIYRMARVVAALENYAREVAPRLGNHPRCGPATLSVGTIHGGMSVNIVPDHCVIEIDRRLMPGEQVLDVYHSIIEHVTAAAGGQGIEHDRPFSINPGLADRLNGALAERLLAAVRPSCPSAETVGVAYGTDAATISAAEIPAVVFGPGSINQAHTADEWIDLAQLQAASDTLYRFVAGPG
jgi:acetylornithine deacetylase